MNPVSDKSERKRGHVEATRQFEVLRAKWPKAFPSKSHNIRPLASGAAAVMADDLGWTRPYAKSVLKVWKLREAYCRAVLAHGVRIALDGTPSGELVDDTARQFALERIAACQRLREKRLQAKLALAAP
jgi:sRNA-binding protein